MVVSLCTRTRILSIMQDDTQGILFLSCFLAWEHVPSDGTGPVTPCSLVS